MKSQHFEKNSAKSEFTAFQRFNWLRFHQHRNKNPAGDLQHLDLSSCLFLTQGIYCRNLCCVHPRSRILVEDHLTYKRLGGTLDDAAGEAFDKIARLLDLGYPGGPAIQAAAEIGDPRDFNFPRAWLDDTWNFSFSGLKTAVLREVRRLQAERLDLPVANLAASFQQAVTDVLVGKTLKAAEAFQVREILISGGVSANKALRVAILSQAEHPVHIPPLPLCTDNAAMVAGAGYYRYINGQKDSLNIDALPNWPLSEL